MSETNWKYIEQRRKESEEVMRNFARSSETLEEAIENEARRMRQIRAKERNGAHDFF